MPCSERPRAICPELPWEIWLKGDRYHPAKCIVAFFCENDAQEYLKDGREYACELVHCDC